MLLFACTANPHNNTSYQVMKASPAMGCFPCRLGSTVHTSLEQICITWGGEGMIFPKLLFFRSQQTTACRLSIHLSMQSHTHTDRILNTFFTFPGLLKVVNSFLIKVVVFLLLYIYIYDCNLYAATGFPIWNVCVEPQNLWP